MGILKSDFSEYEIEEMELSATTNGIPTHVSKWHIKAYFDEFCFRINHLQFKNSIFIKQLLE